MDEIARPYNLIISNGVPEDWFISQYGQDLFDTLKAEAFIYDRGRCAGCGHEPPAHRKQECLFFHIYELNRAHPELTKGTTLCKMCHATQHIESAIKNKWVSLVNSTHDQNNLIRLTRGNQIYSNVNQRLIVNLKKTPEQFLKDFYEMKVKLTSTLKVTFTNNFNIDDLY